MPRARTHIRTAGLFAIGLAAVLALGLFGLARWPDRTDGAHPADPSQPPERIQDLAALDVMRAGSVELRIVEPGAGADTALLRYRFSRPGGRAEDADIRGFLDGETKYLFNQGTSFHMRVGRRYSGGYHGELELKRSLVRWGVDLPAVPDAFVAGARIRLWLEKHHTDSPLDSPDAPTLHLYAYAADTDWAAGGGGTGRDDFSEPAPGEVSWEAARAGERPWSYPGGGLRPVTAGAGTAGALAYAPVAAVDTFVVLDNGPLTERLRTLYEAGDGELGVLLKLDDAEEDLRGTEMSIMSSEYGSDEDLVPRRPVLEVDLAVPGRETVRRWDFALEPGASAVFPPVPIARGSALLAVDVGGGTGAPPTVWLRGGAGDRPGSDWIRLDGNPVSVQGWDRVQVMATAAPRTVVFGDTFDVAIKATWISPGPRAEQAPELALVAPSGRVHRVRGAPVDSSVFRMSFAPRELGLWRYGWSLRPSPVYPPGAHEGEGLFFVRPPESSEESLARLRELAGDLLEHADSVRANRGPYQAQFNNFVRWAADVEHAGNPADSAAAADLLRQVRLRIGPRRYDATR